MPTPFYTGYNRPPQQKTVLDYDTVHVSQSEAKVASLQYQLERFGMSGLQAQMEQMREKFGYADCTKVPSFAEAQQQLAKATQYFEALPSKVRQAFGHRPEAFYDFIEKNPEEARKQGFITPTAKQQQAIDEGLDIQKTNPKVIKDAIDINTQQVIKSESVTKLNNSITPDNLQNDVVAG